MYEKELAESSKFDKKNISKREQVIKELYNN
jgi:hypothetical protein